jgi:hypothetical protein
MAKLKNSGGMLAGGDLKVDLSDYVGMTASVNGSFDYLFDGQYAWSGGLSVSPMSALTLSFSADADQVEGSDFDYSAGLNYTYGSATLYGTFASDYDTTDEASYETWTLGTKISF